MDLDKIIKERSEEFEVFLVEIPMLLDDLADLLKKSNNYNDINELFTEETLDKIESYYLDVLDGKEKINISMNRLTRILLAYIGEFLINKASRGKWDINKMKKSSNVGMIGIVDYANIEHFAVYPLKLLNYIKETREKTLKSSLMYSANLEQEEKDFFNKYK